MVTDWSQGGGHKDCPIKITQLWSKQCSKGTIKNVARMENQHVMDKYKEPLKNIPQRFEDFSVLLPVDRGCLFQAFLSE